MDEPNKEREAPEVRPLLDEYESCELRLSVTEEVFPCDGRTCVYWRVLDHVGVVPPSERGCALQHFGVALNERPELSHWLLSVKRRVEAQEAQGPDSRE